MLQYFDANKMPVLFKTGSGEVVDIREISDGLVGELYSDDGWVAKFSRFPPQGEMRLWYGMTDRPGGN